MAMIVLDTVCISTISSMMPRFIISMRELYDRDPRGRWKGIDSGFKIFPQPISGESAGTSMSVIPFVDIGPEGPSLIMEGATNEFEMIRLEVLGVNARQV
jgi:hypothetical protein